MIRLNAVPDSGFRHGGIEVGKAWASFEKLDEKQRATVRDFHGRFIRVHPDDVAKLKDIGLRFVDGASPLEELQPKTTNPPPKGDEKTTTQSAPTKNTNPKTTNPPPKGDEKTER